MHHPDLFHTDLYQLTMSQSYFDSGQNGLRGTFELFFRKLPFGGGYAVFCGRNAIENFLDNIENSIINFDNLVKKYGFAKNAKDYFKKAGFSNGFIEYLLTGLVDDIKALEIKTVEEGEIVYPHTPMVQVTGKMIPMQILETPLLQMVNSQSIIATKAARIKNSARDRLVADFGLRRAHNPNLTYAAMVGGCDATSNVIAGVEMGVSITGTIAHSFIMSYGAGSKAELKAFKDYIKSFPDDYSLLVDTFDIKTGIENAIKVADENNGRGFKAIRIDSGDICYWAVTAREMLDKAGYKNVKIVASNDLDEYVIESLDNQAHLDYNYDRVPVDAFGIGTRLITAYDNPALGAVYKLVEINKPDKTPVIKVSGNKEKITIPFKKDLYRVINSKGEYIMDYMTVADEKEIQGRITACHKDHEELHTELDLKEFRLEPLLKPLSYTPFKEINVQEKLKNLPKWHKRLKNPHYYKVGLSKKLFDLRQKLIKQAS